MKAGGKQGNRLAGISDYIGNRKEMEDSKLVLTGLPIGQKICLSVNCTGLDLMVN
jgi:hypothetical protein